MPARRCGKGLVSMSEKTIRAKYGGHLAKAINRAIRAEVRGGNVALELLTQLAGAARHSGWKDKKGKHTDAATAYYRHKREVIDAMDAQVRRRWEIPASAKPREGPARRSPGNRARVKPGR